MNKEYTDQTPFPFGKHKGKTIEQVPAEYLIWCLENVKELDIGIKNYINANMQGLKQEMAKRRRK